MALVSTATTNFDATVTALVMQRLEDILAAKYPHISPGNHVEAQIVKGTNQLTFVAYAALASDSTALVEGTAPSTQSLAISVDTITAAQMGQTVTITDVAIAESPHNLVGVAADRLSDQAANTLDKFVRDILAAGTNVAYSNGSARSTVSATITGALVKKMVGKLRAANVDPFPDGFYRAIIHPRQEFDLQADTSTGGWMDVHKYADSQMGANLLSGEIGAYAGVRFMISSNAKVFATAGLSAAQDVCSAFFFGPDAYAVGDLQSLTAKFVAPGGDHSDPLAQKAILGWKAMLGGALLDANGARYVRLETAATALSSGDA